MTTKPVFVLLHGAWHTPRCWDRLIARLDAAGYASVAPALPSSGSDPPTPDWFRDVETIRDTVSDLIQEQDVVVVAHSFSGMTGGTAMEGLDKEASLSRGLKGGVVRMIYIAAILVPEGFQHSPRGTRDNMLPEMKTDLEVCPLSPPPPEASYITYDVRLESLPSPPRMQRSCSIRMSTTRLSPSLREIRFHRASLHSGTAHVSFVLPLPLGSDSYSETNAGHVGEGSSEDSHGSKEGHKTKPRLDQKDKKYRPRSTPAGSSNSEPLRVRT